MIISIMKRGEDEDGGRVVRSSLLSPSTLLVAGEPFQALCDVFLQLVRNSSGIRKVSQNEVLANPGVVEFTEDRTLEFNYNTSLRGTEEGDGFTLVDCLSREERLEGLDSFGDSSFIRF